MVELESLPTNHAELLFRFRNKPVDPDSYVMIPGPGNFPLAQKVAEMLDKKITDPCSIFPDSQETKVRIEENMRRKEVFIFQSMFPNPNDRFMEVIQMTDAAKRGDATKIRAVTPYLAYSREDRKTAPRMPISIALVAQTMIDRGAGSLFTMEIHSGQAQGMISAPWDDVSGLKVILPKIKEFGLEEVTVVSPDTGGGPRAEKILRQLQNGDGHDLAFVYKKRDPKKPETSEAKSISGDVKDRPVVIYDDLIGTGGTIFNAAELVKQNGATKVVVAATHALFAKDTDGKTLPERLLEPNCPIDKLVVTNTIDQSQREDVKAAEEKGKLEVLSVHPVIAVAIFCYLTGESIRKNLID